MVLSSTRDTSGASLIEAAIAACTSALFLGSLFTMNMTAMKTMRTAREATAASQVLQQRVESLRIANWHQVTNPDWISANLLNANAAGSNSLYVLSETLTLIPYGSASTSATQLYRTNGTTQIQSRNANLVAESAMKVVWTVSVQRRNEHPAHHAADGGHPRERRRREMVTFRKTKPTRARHTGGFTLVEMLISTAIFSAVSAALLMGFISLKRNYVATTDFAINHADQMRISDYLALDFRRALKVDPPAQNDVTIYIPTYYDNTPERNPVTPSIDGKGGVFYDLDGDNLADDLVKIRYYLSNGVIYRQEGEPTSGNPPVALAVDVKDFVITTTDLQKVIKTSITFKPTFRNSGVSEQIALSTAFHNTTLLRNNRGVY